MGRINSPPSVYKAQRLISPLKETTDRRLWPWQYCHLAAPAVIDPTFQSGLGSGAENISEHLRNGWVLTYSRAPTYAI